MVESRPRTHWDSSEQSSKRQRTLSLTEDAWALLGSLAATCSANRSEVVEIMVRQFEKDGTDLSSARSALLS